MIKYLVLAVVSLLLSGCNFFDKDNTPIPAPLMPFAEEVHPRLLWSSKVGSGSGSEYLKLNPVLNGCAIYTAGTNGVVTSTNKANGNTFWRVNTGMCITAGPGAGDGIVAVGSRRGEVMALQQTDGRILWRGTIDGEILANPVIRNDVVVIKTVDGTVRGLSVSDGHLIWSYQQVEPSLILRGSSTPALSDNVVFAGFANGNLAKLNLHDGQIDWLHTIAVPEGAFSVQRMVDIDADPMVYGHRIFAATYQGKIASLDWRSGSTLWSHDISSYTGMTAENNAIYISDAKSHVWAFGANSGLVNWRQTELEARNISPPAMMCNYVVVGDAEGYLHWLNKCDGHFAGRVFAGNTIIAAPIAENNVLYALTSNGSLVAYTLS